MALSSAMVWEFRSGATAGNLNGGGFNPSNAIGNTNDYSQQNAAQYNFTDLASSNATTNPAVVTSVNHSFVNADVGNIIHITAGTNWTTGWYEIVSVSGGAATLDRACGTSAAVSSGTYYVGGAMSFANGLNTALVSSMVAGNTVHIKRGTYVSPTVTITFINGAAATRIYILGYDSVRGDAPVGDSRPIINVGNAVLTIGSDNVCENIIFTGIAASVVTTSARSRFKNIKVINTSTTAAQAALNVSSAGVTVLSSEFISYRGNAVLFAGSATAYFYGCYIHDSNIGVSQASGSAGIAFIGCVISSNVTKAVDCSGTANSLVMILNCTLYGAEDKLGSAIVMGASAFSHTIFNNIIYGFVTGINDTNGIGRSFGDFNNFYNNTTDRTTFTTGANDVAIAPAFTNVAQLTGTAATTSGSVLTDGAANFSTVTDNKDFVYIKSGTGVTAGKYLITSHTTTTLTLDIAPGTSAVADKVYQVITGMDFSIGLAMKGIGFPLSFAGGRFSNSIDLGGLQSAGGTAAGASDVRLGVATGFTTGTLVVPSAANVKTGISFDTASTGTYDGSDRWTDPGVTNVRSATAYKANSTLNNRTGTVVVPSASDVKTGVSCDTASTGTYNGSDRWTDPGEANVRLATAYKANSTSNNKTGTVVIPLASKVKNGVSFDTSSTGTFTGIAYDVVFENITE